MGQMHRVAVLENGVVENVILADEDFEIPGKTLIRLSEVCPEGFDTVPVIEMPKGCPGPGWAHDGTDFVHPDDIPTSKLQLKEYLGLYRFSVESGGFSWEDKRIGTSRIDQNTFLEIRMRATQFPDEEITYKTKDGKFITATLKELSPLAEAVYQHVKKCFTAEAYTFRMVEDGSVTTINQVAEVFDSQIK